jgi:rhamnosyltransferase
MRILAGITVYNADREKLLENVSAIIGQVDGLLLVDNGSEHVNETEEWLNHKLNEKQSNQCFDQTAKLEEFFSSKILWEKNHQNLGVAKALNQMFEYAEEKGYDWVLTLDQDSVCPQNMITEYKKYIDLPALGILTPLLLDRNYDRVAESQGEYEELKDCITSGSLSPLSAWKKCGGFTEELFIDYVDYDFNAKIREAGFKIYRINSVRILHEIGRGENHRFFSKKITVLNHLPSRHYYIIRNWNYYMAVHKDILDLKYEKKKYLFHFIKTMLYEDKKIEKWKEMMRGRKDAKELIASRLGKE